MKLGSRIFAPRPFTTLLTLVLLVALVSLGRWQLRRASEKQVLFNEYDRGTDSTRRIDLKTALLPRYQHVAAQGHYDGTRQILIDNMTDDNGHAGYYVITPFLLVAGGWLLVNRGWVPIGVSRSVMPPVGVSDEPRTIRGRADHLPAAGIAMGHPAPLQPVFPAVATFPSRTAIGQVLQVTSWSSAADVVLLDADQPDGYVRRWQAPGFPPLRHIGYAIQWFGLAVAHAIIYLVTNLRRAAP